MVVLSAILFFLLTYSFNGKGLNVSTNCPVCEAPAEQQCTTCKEAMVNILTKALPQQEKPAMAYDVQEQATKLINICSGEDVCLS